jgi:uncharacterized protein (DUF302 family)
MAQFVFSTRIEQPVDEAIETLKTALAKHKLGIVSDVNVSGIVKAKLGEEMPAYRILGACNPGMAKTMIEQIPQAGALLPCTIVARDDNGATVFDVMDPITVLGISNNDTMKQVAAEATDLLRAAIEDLDA